MKLLYNSIGACHILNRAIIVHADRFPNKIVTFVNSFFTLGIIYVCKMKLNAQHLPSI